MRVQPWRGRVRPHAEGAFGLAGLWSSTALRDVSGADLRRDESQRSVSFIAGVGVGLDVSLLTLAEHTIFRSSLMLSAGIRRVYTGNMALPAFAADDETARSSTARQRMRMWQPFLALALSVETKPRPRELQKP